jgi:cytoskeletal protein RodZ
MLIFIALKNPSLRVSLNPRILDPVTSTLTITPPRRQNWILFYSSLQWQILYCCIKFRKIDIFIQLCPKSRVRFHSFSDETWSKSQIVEKLNIIKSPQQSHHSTKVFNNNNDDDDDTTTTTTTTITITTTTTNNNNNNNNRNITRHKESGAIWDLKPERWGSPLAQEEKYHGRKKTCDKK